MTVTLALPTDAAAVKGPPQGRWNYQDWESLPDDGNRYEIIDGVLFTTAIPSFFHQWLVMRLCRFVGIPAEDRKMAFPVLGPIGLIMPGCEPVQPDFVLVLAQNKQIIRDRRIFGVPDLIVEVMSPGSTAYDEDIKLTAYANAGVPEYGIVDPAQRQLRLYQLQAPGEYGAAIIFTESDTVTFNCLPTISFGVAQLFADAPDTTL